MLTPLLVESGPPRCHAVQVGYRARSAGASRVTLVSAVALVAAVAGCTTTAERRPAPRATVTAEPETKADVWMNVATDADEARIDRIGLAWQESLAEARRGHRREVEAEGVLLRPRAALPRPAPTPGSYNCRLIKLGRTRPNALAFEKFKPFFCYVEVEGDLLTIVKQTGSQRPAGRLWDDDRPDRLIFLGSLALGNEEQPRAYGEDPRRDMAGVFERVGPFRWRLVIPWPQDSSKLHVFELTPVAQQPEG